MNFKTVGLLSFLFIAVGSLALGDDPCLEHAKKGDYDKAIDACTTAINSPGHANFLAYDNRGFSYFKKGQYDKAIADFTKALELNARDEYAYTIRALAHEGKKQYDKAIADWSASIKLAPAEYNYVNRARLYRDREQYSEAIADYTKVISLQPTKATGYWFRAAAYYEIGLFEKGVGDYRKLIEIYGRDYADIKLDLLYMRLLNAAGKLSKSDYDNVLKELGAYVASSSVSSDDERWWRTIARYRLGADDLSDDKLLAEVQTFKSRGKMQERLCDAYYTIGEKKLTEGDRKDAQEFFRKSIETGINSFSSRFARAMLRLMQEGKI